MKVFDTAFLETILVSNAPWLKQPEYIPPTALFFREAFKKVKQQLDAKHGMAMLIKGPRRVGKTEIQRQLIAMLLKEGIKPARILYLSLDDVQIQSVNPKDRWRMVNELLNAWAVMLGYQTFDQISETTYLFLDEVQSVENWAQLLKNRIERNPYVKIVLSGSAAHSIFKKSLEILMGRVISIPLGPFSFREYFRCQLRGDLHEETMLYNIQNIFERDFSASNLYKNLYEYSQRFKPQRMMAHMRSYLENGGFPQLWKIPAESIIEKAHIIDENYVQKVTLEDLMLLRSIRKPELFERLLRHLFARPGQEYNQQKVASELGTTIITLNDAMDLLRQTDLLLFIEKFSAKAEPLKRIYTKVYPCDLALTFAMTKIPPTLESENKGLIAESIVAQTLSRLRGISNIAFMKSDSHANQGEIDFYVRSDTRDCPIEVKYQNQIRSEDSRFMEKTILEKDLPGGILITQNLWNNNRSVYSIPLWAFALIS